MGQKVNPIALRLQKTNIHFDSYWCSDYYYPTLISRDLMLRDYLNTIYKQFNYSEGRFLIQHLPKKLLVYQFICSLFVYQNKTKNSLVRPFKKRKANQKNFNCVFVKRNLLVNSNSEYTNNINHNAKIAQLCFYLFQKDVYSQNISKQQLIFDKGCYAKKAEKLFLFRYFLVNLVFYQGFFKTKQSFLFLKDFVIDLNYMRKKLQELFFSSKVKTEKSLLSSKQNVSLSKNVNYREHLETTLYNQFLTNVFLLTFKASTPFQSALFLAQEIVYCLERKVSFREIKINLTRSLEIKKVKGVRISCSGRLGGRSKKAQRAKTESLKLGQTSLHVFSNKIDFKSAYALTPYGVVGVKVWICFY